MLGQKMNRITVGKEERDIIGEGNDDDNDKKENENNETTKKKKQDYRLQCKTRLLRDKMVQTTTIIIFPIGRVS